MDDGSRISRLLVLLAVLVVVVVVDGELPGCGRLCGGARVRYVGRKGILQGAGRARDDVMFKPTSPEHKAGTS